MLADDAFFQVCLFVGQHGDGGDLGAGAGGGGHGDHRQAACWNTVDADHVGDGGVVGRDEGRHLGDIQSGTTAEPDQQVGPAGLGGGDTILDQADTGVRLHTIEEGIGNAGFA